MASDRELLQLTCETLTEAIEKLRAEAADVDDWYGGTGTVWGEHVATVANDLALLHDRLKLEKDRLDDIARLGAIAWKRQPWPNVHAEEIADEVLRGEHDDHDWSPD